MIDASFWRGRRTLVTGHTGFKGSWLCAWLRRLGTHVSGIALAPATEPNLFTLLDLEHTMESRLLDLRDREATIAAVAALRPEIVIHMAAQALVRRGIDDPYQTFTTNVVGSVNLIDAARVLANQVAIVNVTSDKVYRADERDHAFCEEDPLGGDDPYSASKACAEMVSAAYATTQGTRISTARAGNVIGGGDWSADRLIPDLVRAIERGGTPVLRNPESTRPWQHVLDALYGYLLLAQGLRAEPALTGEAWNFGPQETAPMHVAEVTEMFLRRFSAPALWEESEEKSSVERRTLCVDSTKARTRLGWRSRLTIHEAIDWTADWYARRQRGENPLALTVEQIAAYEAQ